MFSPAEDWLPALSEKDEIEKMKSSLYDPNEIEMTFDMVAASNVGLIVNEQRF